MQTNKYGSVDTHRTRTAVQSSALEFEYFVKVVILFLMRPIL